MVIAVIVAAAVTVAVIGDPQNTVDGAYRATDAGANDAANSAAHGTCDAITLIRAFLGAPHDPLAVTGLRHANQGKKDGSAGEKQANRQTRRQLRGGNTSFVHLES